MPRKLRDLRCDMVYHVVCKANHGEFLLRPKEVKSMYLSTVKRYRLKMDFEVYGFCILDNHIHLLIKTGTTPLSKIMQCINQSFTQRYNNKFEKRGHFFDGRYFSSLCQTLGSIMKTLAYIHLNPYKAGITKSLSYLWSSHYAYAGYAKNVWFDSRSLMKRIKDNLADAIAYYRQELDTFRNDTFFFEYQEPDVIQTPVTFDVLLKKLSLNRRSKTLDHLVKASLRLHDSQRRPQQNEKVQQIEIISEGLVRSTSPVPVFADGHPSKSYILKTLVLLNHRLKLISGAELARRLNVNRSLIQKMAKNLKHVHPSDNVNSSTFDQLLQQVVAYINFDPVSQIDQKNHFRHLESIFFEALRLVHAI